MTEELALEERLGDGRAIHGDEGPIGALPVGVNCTGDEFLARSALARDQHHGVLRRDLDDPAEHVANRLGATDDAVEVIFSLNSCAKS